MSKPGDIQLVGHGRFECKHGFLVQQCRCMNHQRVTTVDCFLVPAHGQRLEEAMAEEERLHPMIRVQIEDGKVVDTQPVPETKSNLTTKQLRQIAHRLSHYHNSHGNLGLWRMARYNCNPEVEGPEDMLEVGYRDTEDVFAELAERRRLMGDEA